MTGSSEHACIRNRVQHEIHVSSYDFLADLTEDDRQIKLFAVIDEYTRECLTLEVARSFLAEKVVANVEHLTKLQANESQYGLAGRLHF